jgi:3-oxoacyl-[acyl-carrier-protein] synthase II
MKKRRVVVTGLGVVSSIGIGWKAFWESLLAGRSGIRRISYIDTTEYPSHFGGEVTGFEPTQFMEPQVAKQVGRGTQFAIAASRMALEDAGLIAEKTRQARVGVCLGTTMADIQALETMNNVWVNKSEARVPGRLVPQYPGCMMSTNIAKHFNFLGPNITVPTACAAGNYAIGYAADLLRAGRADVVIAGGVDPFSRIAFTGFNRLLAVAPERCQPFDLNRRGTIVGEGAGVMVLERLEDAEARGALCYAEILGYGLSCDGHHMTIPDVDGIARVMEKALRDADVSPTDVDYISAHGTGTPANDKTECAAIRRVFGPHTDHMPVSSIKSMLGHTMGAASALEAMACVLAIHEGKIPPTINHEADDPECAIDCVPNTSRAHASRIILNNSFAFGGNNACVVIGR